MIQEEEEDDDSLTRKQGKASKEVKVTVHNKKLMMDVLMGGSDSTVDNEEKP